MKNARLLVLRYNGTVNNRPIKEIVPAGTQCPVGRSAVISRRSLPSCAQDFYYRAHSCGLVKYETTDFVSWAAEMKGNVAAQSKIHLKYLHTFL